MGLPTRSTLKQLLIVRAAGDVQLAEWCHGTKSALQLFEPSHWPGKLTPGGANCGHLADQIGDPQIWAVSIFESSNFLFQFLFPSIAMRWNAHWFLQFLPSTSQELSGILETCTHPLCGVPDGPWKPRQSGEPTATTGRFWESRFRPQPRRKQDTWGSHTNGCVQELGNIFLGLLIGRMIVINGFRWI